LITVREFISAAAREFGFTDEDVSKIALAVDEACTNVIKHAYRFDRSRKLTITIEAGRGKFQVVVSDNGAPFDPEDLATPDMQEYLKNFKKGGLGVYLMRRLMDEVSYHSEPGKKNEVRLTKFLHR
jgi:serine/threonine-protein kinase RsbW